MLKKYLMLGIAMVFIMTLPLILTPVSASVPTSPTGAGGAVQNPTMLTEYTVYGGGPATVDPAAAYDTASRELLQNAYDTLIFFDGEQCGNVPNSGVSDEYLPGLATQVTVGPPPAGAPAYTNFTVYFAIRGTNPATGAGTVPFQTWSRSDIGNLTWPQFYLTAQDVAYSFDRLMVHAYAFEGSFWLITDALLLQDSITNANLTSATFTTYLQGAVQYNNTYCWFNIPNANFATGTQTFAPVNMFNSDGSWNANFWTATAALPIDYPLNTFMQVWAQQWASIVSYDWTVNWLNPYLYAHGNTDTQSGDEIEWTFGPTTGGVAARNDWNNWSDYYNPSLPIYDEVGSPGGVTCGTGPYILEVYNPALGGEYVMARFTSYWGGWPASWPNPPYPPQAAGDTKPEGYCDTFAVIQESPYFPSINYLAAGSADFAPVQLASSAPILPSGINGPTIPGVQCDYPIPELETESFFMNQNISVAFIPGYFGTINGPAQAGNPANFSSNGIPSNFFSDVNVRLAFAYALNITNYIQNQFLGRAYEPVTCAPDGFPYINMSQPTYNINLALAQYYMNHAWGGGKLGFLNGTGFAVDLIYDSGNAEREQMMENLAYMINSLGPPGKFNAVAVGVNLGTELAAMTLGQLPTFMSGTLADYSDLHDFMFTYMDSVGMYAQSTGYSNPTVDALLQQIAYTNDATVLTADYGQLEQIYYDDVPSVTLITPVGTGFQRDWVQGHYYNPLYPGIYAYNMWKYNGIPGDVNRDGAVTMADIIDAENAYGSYDGQLGAGGGFWPLMQADWNFYADVIGTPREEWTDRTIDMGDIVTIISYFGEVDTPTGSPGGAPYWNGAWNETSGWYGVP